MSISDIVIVLTGLHARTPAEINKGVPPGLAEAMLTNISKQFDRPKVLVTYNSQEPDDAFKGRFADIKVRYVKLDVLNTQDMINFSEELEEFAPIDTLVHCVSGLYQSSSSVDELGKPYLDANGNVYSPKERRNSEMLRRMKANKYSVNPDQNRAKLQQINQELVFEDEFHAPDPNIMTAKLFTPEEQRKTLKLTADSYLNITKAVIPHMNPNGKIFSYSFTGHEKTPNYEVLSPAKKRIEEHVLLRMGSTPAEICISTGPFPSPSTLKMVYFKEFLGLIKEKFPDTHALTSNDVALETLRLMQNGATGGIHYFRDEAKDITTQEQIEYFTRILKNGK